MGLIKKNSQPTEYYMDIHSHILPGVDDGAFDVEESRQMLTIAYEDGIRSIVATPHHNPERGKMTRKQLESAFPLLKKMADQVGIEVHLGCELYYTEQLADELERGEVLTWNGGDLILLEFDFACDWEEIRAGIIKLSQKGWRIMLAHLDRYAKMIGRMGELEELCRHGVLITVNADSLLGKKNDPCRQSVEAWIKNGWITCVGSDAHGVNHRPPKMSGAAARIRKLCGEETARALCRTNAEQLLAEKKHVIDRPKYRNLGKIGIGSRN